MSVSIIRITYSVSERDRLIHFENFFESISDYRKSASLVFLIKHDFDLLNPGGFLKNDNLHLCLESEKILMERNEDHLDYIKCLEEAIIERIPNK